MADLGNDGFLDATPTGSDGKAVDLTGSDSGGGGVFGLVVRPIGGPFDVNVISGSITVLTGTFLQDASDVVAVLTSSEAKLCDISSSLAGIPNGQQIVKKRFDLSGSVNLFFVGFADPNTAETAASWRINRITFLGGQPEISEWTTSSFAVWDDRTTEEYQ